MVDMHDFFHVGQHLGGFIEAGFADVQQASVLQFDLGTWPGFEIHFGSLQQCLNFAGIDLQGFF